MQVEYNMYEHQILIPEYIECNLPRPSADGNSTARDMRLPSCAGIGQLRQS
jgi:hypothetical protein